jgi:chemotaxis regulatin CheY-phosphate phosphatase CheZ
MEKVTKDAGDKLHGLGNLTRILAMTDWDVIDNATPLQESMQNRGQL